MPLVAPSEYLLGLSEHQSPKRAFPFGDWDPFSFASSIMDSMPPFGGHVPAPTRTNSPARMTLTTREAPRPPATTTNVATSPVERPSPPPAPPTISHTTETHRTTPAPTYVITTTADFRPPSVSVSVQPGSVTTISSITTISSEATIFTTPDHLPRFFQRKGVVAGVFSALGIIIIGLLLVLFFIVRRHRRAKRVQHDITEPDARELATEAGIHDGEISVSPPRVEQWSTMGEASLGSLSSLYSQTTVSPTWDSDSQTSLLPTTPQSTHPRDFLTTYTQIARYPSPPPAYGDLSRRTTSRTAREYDTVRYNQREKH